MVTVELVSLLVGKVTGREGVEAPELEVSLPAPPVPDEDEEEVDPAVDVVGVVVVATGNVDPLPKSCTKAAKLLGLELELR
jgi:hypothetical protein